MKYTLSSDQVKAMQTIGAWYRSKSSPYLTVGGYAGTGKTTLVAYVRQALRQHDDEARVAFCAFTGKAARVLQETLKSQKVPRKRDSVSTIHSLIYTAEADKAGHPVWVLKDTLERDLIIVDEASMVDEIIWKDLLSFNIPVLAVGDHGQLPPVGSSFNLMAEPAVKLEHIWRQEAESPIIQVATMARKNGEVPVKTFGTGVKKLDRNESETGQAVQEMLENWNPDLLVLCGYNHTRLKLNQAIRTMKGFDSPNPQSGDRVVCLRNNRVSKVYNGMTGTIVRLEKDGKWYEATIALDGEDYNYHGFIWADQFDEKETIKDVPLSPDETRGDLFDFGYALTVHKAQGSQSEQVLLFEERFPKMTDEDWRRWLYTGVTRARTSLTIVGS